MKSEGTHLAARWLPWTWFSARWADNATEWHLSQSNLLPFVAAVGGKNALSLGNFARVSPYVSTIHVTGKNKDATFMISLCELHHSVRVECWASRNYSLS